MKITRILKGAGIRSSYGTMGACAVTLIEDDINILVDTGHFGNRERLISILTKNGFSPSSINVVVLTHINWDHCLNVDLFRNSEIIIGEEEYKSGTLSGVSDQITAKFKEYLSNLNLKKVKDGYHVSRNTEIIGTPGHTPGHISVKVNNENGLTVVSGDAIPNLRAYTRGVPDFVFSNLEQARKSIISIKNMKPDIIIPGHDPPFNKDGYIENDEIDLILRNNEQEENIVLAFKITEADKPVIYNE